MDIIDSQKVALCILVIVTVPLGRIAIGLITLSVMRYLQKPEKVIKKFEWLRTFYIWIGALAVLGGTWAFFLPIAINSGFNKDDDGPVLRQLLIYTVGGILGVITLGETHRKNNLEKDKNDQDHTRQVHAERRSRYTKAIEHLFNENISIRLGGVYTLTGLADEWLADEKTLPNKEERRKETQNIINNLCTYIRSPFPLAEQAEQLDGPYAKDLQKDFKGDKEKFDTDKQVFARDKATLEEERQVRESIIKEIRERLQDFGAPGSWSGFDYDFSNALFFYDTDFRNSYFDALSKFTGARFTKKVGLLGANFTEPAPFSGATFAEGAKFIEANFTKRAPFSGATFAEGALFSKATFEQDADFSGATFTQQLANFFEATFKQDADFSGATFTQGANFSYATFEQDADFSGATLTQQSATFEKVTFEQDANFSRATFAQGALFSEATFTQGANFYKVTFGTFGAFEQDADFSGAIFIRWANFSKAIFRTEPIFKSTPYDKPYTARFSYKTTPESYNFEVSHNSPYKIETEEKEHKHNGVKFIIPKDAELFDPDEPSDLEDDDES